MLWGITIHAKYSPANCGFAFNGELCRYYPDFLIIRGSHLLLVEVKCDDEVSGPDAQEYFGLVKSLLSEHGFEFVLWKKSEISSEPRYTNVGLMLRYRRTRVSEVERERIRKAFNFTTSMSLLRLSEISDVSVQGICHLVLKGMLYIDWWAALNQNSSISTVPIGQQVFPPAVHPK